MSEIVSNGYLVDENGNRMEVVDATARNMGIKVENMAIDIVTLQIDLDEMQVEWIQYLLAIWYRLLTLERHLNLQKPAGTEPPVSDEALDENFSGA